MGWLGSSLQVEKLGEFKLVEKVWLENWKIIDPQEKALFWVGGECVTKRQKHNIA